jgi:hypothetical protein
MWKVVVKSLLALTVVLGLAITASEPADARRGGRIAAGVAVGTLLGLGIAGAYAGGPRSYAYDDGPGCYRGPRQCDWVGRSCWTNRYGEYVCRGGERRCWRPTICD